MTFNSFFHLVTSATLATLAGCAVDSSDTFSSEESITARPRILLSATNDHDALPSKLYRLLDAFKFDPDLNIGKGIESASYSLLGTEPSDVERYIMCTESNMEIVSPDGGGFTKRRIHSCTLQGFDPADNGGQLPRLLVPDGSAKPLAGKLVRLLELGAGEGKFGISEGSRYTTPLLRSS